MADFNRGNRHRQGKHMNQNKGAWTSNCSSGHGGGNWNPRPPFTQPPPPSMMSTPFPPHPGPSPPWSGGPQTPFCEPPPGFSGPPPRGPPPPFSVPPPNHMPPFSGPPPSFQTNTPHPWNSNHPQTTGPWSGPGGGQCGGGQRAVNNVWSDPNLFGPGQRAFDGPQNFSYGGNPHRGRGQHGGRGGRGRGRGRGGHQFHQEHNTKNSGGNFWESGNNSHSNNSDMMNNNHSQNNSGKKKQRVDKRDLPENNKFHCEVCDRGFKTEEKYEEHLSQHVKCTVEGCRYIASPKLVQLHYNTQHRTGVAKRIWSLDSPDAIRKWVEERKRNFPTKENIARKNKERAERRARGEVIENKRFGKMRGQGRGRRGHRGRGQYSGGHRWTPWNDETLEDLDLEIQSQMDGNACSEGDRKTQSSSSKTDGMNKKGVNGKGDNSQEQSAPEPKAKKRKLDDKDDDVVSVQGDSRDPLSLVVDREGDSDSTDSSEDSSDDSSEDPSPSKPSGEGLASLMASYDNDSSSSSREDAVLPDESACTSVAPEASTDGAKQEESGELSALPPTTEVVVSTDFRPKGEEPAWIRHNKQRRDQKYRNNVLLERLLANEIRHERNVLLQCVHYIVKNNFLGVVRQKKDTDVGK
ncbi:FMR1-interacting protein NUFIP1-like [Babylonia areolata]|uniref:FMR1-interacting protein NUFIP1-like n=1 Tax=Babylonia areolata TaxID=304850 RepID=UPI003FD549F1